MQAQTYRIVARSRSLEGLAVSCWCMLLLISVVMVGPNSAAFALPGWVVIILVFGSLIAAILLGRRLGRAEVEMTLSDAGIARKWLKHFGLPRRTCDMLKWNEVVDWTVVPSAYDGCLLRIRTNVRDGHLSLRADEDDEFARLLHDFELCVNDRNALVRGDDPITPGNGIQRSPNIYERPTGRVIAWIGLVLIGVVVVLLIVKKGNGDAAATAGLIGMFPAAIWGIRQAFRSRRSRR